MQRLKISANGRHFMLADGQPFFWLADTAWELFHKLNADDTAFYLSERVGQGFNVVQAVVLAELDGINTPNANGDLPLHEKNPALPNEKYFIHIDQVIKSAASKGIYIALLPTWGDKVSKRYDWAKGPELFNEENALVYARWLALRYGKEDNIIWILGGDRNPDEREKRIWSAMAKGIVDTDPGALLSFHPQPVDGKSSAAWFHEQEWLKFNMLQTGHDRHTAVRETVARDYARIPSKPVLNGEPVYEAHPLSFRVSEGYSTDADVRRDAYFSVFSGACGHTYGCHSVWQFHTACAPGVNHPLFAWREALHLSGADQLRHLSRLISGRPPLKRIPGDDLLLPDEENGVKNQIVAARADDGSYAFIYTALGNGITIQTGVFKAGALTACWMSPRDGAVTVSRLLTKQPIMEFTPPSSGPGCDWVLVLDVV